MRSVIAQPTERRRQPQSLGLQVAVLVASEIARQGITAMLSALAAVEEVQVWDAAQIESTPPAPGLDVLIIRFDDFADEAVDKAAQEARQNGIRVLLLLSHGSAEMLDLVATISNDGFLVQDELTSQSLAASLGGVAAAGLPAAPPGRAADGTSGRARTKPDLTPREWQVLELIVAGLSNKEIASRLRISPHGVKRLVSSVLAKLGAPNRTLAAAMAITDKLLAQE